jgi:phage portal protein BeeE
MTARRWRVATRRQRRAHSEERFGFDEWMQFITSGNAVFPITGINTTLGGTKREPLEHSFPGYVRGIFKRNSIAFSCMELRRAVFSEVTFRFAQVNNGKRGQLFGTAALDVLEKPWPNGTMGDLASRMIQDTDLAGNFYAVRRGNTIYRRSPEKMRIVLTGDPRVDEFVDIAGYVYLPNGDGGPQSTYLPTEVCHWAPIPDPEALYRGMSWLTPVIREIEADGAATDHKTSYFRNGATPNFAVTLPQDVMTQEQFEDFRTKMLSAHRGPKNAYKTLYLAPGADVKPLGATLEQLAFNDTQGRDESRIAAAAGVPAVLAGLKESLQGSSLNTGTQGQARRRFADGTMRPLYRSAAASLQTLVPAPSASSILWYDDSQVAFFREDRADSAEIQVNKATMISTLVAAGYEPESVVRAVEAEDMTLLTHTGLYSVQLQPPATAAPAPAPL